MKYTGGLAVDTAGVQSTFPKIELAAIKQVMFEFQNLKHIGVTSITAEGGSISQIPGNRLVQSVRGMLRAFRRNL